MRRAERDADWWPPVGQGFGNSRPQALLLGGMKRVVQWGGSRAPLFVAHHLWRCYGAGVGRQAALGSDASRVCTTEPHRKFFAARRQRYRGRHDDNERAMVVPASSKDQRKQVREDAVCRNCGRPDGVRGISGARLDQKTTPAERGEVCGIAAAFRRRSPLLHARTAAAAPTPAMRTRRRCRSRICGLLESSDRAGQPGFDVG